MTTLLPALRDYLKRNLVPADKKITPERPLRLCEVKPNAWIVQNRASTSFPGLFIWGLSKNTIEGKFNDTLTEVMTVQLTLYMQSTDPNLATFNTLQGIYPLSDRIVSLLGDNKKLVDVNGANPVVTGMFWSIRRIDGQLITPDPYTFHGVSQDLILEYHREGVEWHWLQNDETQSFNFM